MLGIYCRISKDRKNQVSIDTQRDKGVEFAEEQGLRYEVYVDQGYSGRKSEQTRPEYMRLMNDIESGKIDSLYIYERSRSDRNIGTWVSLAENLKEKGLPLYIKGKYKDLRDNDTYYQLVQYAIYDQKYADETAEKIQDALATNARKGKAFAVNPYGYKTGEGGVLEIDEEEAKVVKDIFEMSFSGKGTDSIAIELRKREIPTRRGGTWSGKQVQDIIKNPIHKGQRRWGSKMYNAPAILDTDYWERVNKNLKDNRNSGEKQMKFDYLLKGLCICGVCGRNYYGRKRKAEEGKKPKDNYYMCSSKRKGQKNCGNRSIGIDKLEGLIWDRVIVGGDLKKTLLDFMDRGEEEELRADLAKRKRDILSEIKSIENKRKKSFQLAQVADIDVDLFASEMKAMNNKIEVLNADLRRVNDQLSKSELRKREILRDYSEKNLLRLVSFNDKKDFLKKYIDKVVILSDESTGHYVGVNIYGFPFPMIYHVAMRGKITSPTVKEARKVSKKLSTDIYADYGKFARFKRLYK
jgi:DNA invertase Pin-like site-specific DNA recombinase